jgi:hypothetical protein
MGEWLVRPHPSKGWQVLTPGRTQATSAADQYEAISKAVRMVADEGGGQLVVSHPDGLSCERQTIWPSARPYQRRDELDAWRYPADSA